jgi:hypothetical protein
MKLGHFGKKIRNTWNVLKRGVELKNLEKITRKDHVDDGTLHRVK